MAARRNKSGTNSGAVYAFAGTAAAPAGATLTGANGEPVRRFTKDLIRVGKFMKGEQDVSVDSEMLDHWVAQFDAMSKAGVKVYVPSGHTNDPDKNRGWVAEMYREGDTLYGVLELVGEDAIKMAARTEVSIYVPTSVPDGKGGEFERAIEHVALVVDPVIPDQGGFVPITASRGNVKVPVYRLSQEQPMNAWNEVAAALGIATDGLDEAAIKAACEEKLKALAASQTKAAETETALKAARAEVSTLKASRSAKVEVDADTLDTLAEAAETSLDILASRGIQSPAVINGVKALIVGPADARNTVCLSRKAGEAAGLTTAKGFARALIDILAKNDPVECGKVHTKSQAVALNRQTPDADGNTDDGKWVDEEIKANRERHAKAAI